MARTLILNISASAQTLPAIYGNHAVPVGYGRVVSDESSVVVSAMGGFEAMDGIWAVSAISTDTALGAIDVASGGVALLAQFVGGGGGGGGGPVSWSDILNKPTFSTVATSGAYADLSGKPTLATVATSGSYADLSGTPTLPTAANTTATDVGSTSSAGVLSTYSRADHQHAHGNQAGGALHSTATTIAAGFMSAADKSRLDGLATVATSGAYADLTGKPSLAVVATSGSYSDLSGKPSLAAVATSGSATDLANQPYDIAGSAAGTPTVSVDCFYFLAVRACSLLATGHRAKCKTAPTNTTTFTLKLNGASIGTVEYTVAGGTTGTVTITSGPVAVADGDTITLAAPANLNGIVDPYFTFKTVLA